MTERSMFWSDGAGDGGAYSQDQLRLLGQATAASFAADIGVFPSALNGLRVTSSGNNNITVDTGAAVVNGTYYLNDASRSLTSTSPLVGTTGRRVVLEKSWSARTVRIVILTSADGTASIPALTQTDGGTWQIPLASFTITTGGVIGVLTDQRVPIGDPIELIRSAYLSPDATGKWRGVCWVGQPPSAQMLDASSAATAFPCGIGWEFAPGHSSASLGLQSLTDVTKGMSGLITAAVSTTYHSVRAAHGLTCSEDAFDASVVICLNNQTARNVFFGYASTASPADGNNRVGFRVLDNGNLIGVADSAGTETTRDSGLAGSASPGTSYALRIVGSAGTVKFYVNGAQVGADVTTNIPTTASMNLILGVYTTDASAKYLAFRDAVATIKAA